MSRRQRTASIWFVVAAGLTACGSSSDDAGAVTTTPGTPTTTASATTAATTSLPPTTVAPTPTDPPTTTTAAAPPEAASMRGGRYCEVLLVRPIDGVPSAEVYNSYPLNDCPADTWASLDAAAIATSQGVPLAVLNGPRYWLMDGVETTATEPPPPVDFGGIEMTLRATVDLGSIGAGEPPYTEHRVNRRTVFRFDSGSTVYEMTAADGSVYVMQSWSQQVDPALDEPALAGLGSRLGLPEGWTFQPRVLDQPLEVVTTETDAVVLQDELGNSYSKRT